MLQMRIFIPLLSLVFIFTACNNDDTAESNEPGIPLYGIKVGNEWTYDYYKRIFNNSNEFEKLTATDLVTVTGYEEIEGATYFSLTTTTTNSENSGVGVPENGTVITKVKDSLGYLVDLQGKILFSSVATEPYLISSANWGNVYSQLNENSVTIPTIFGVSNTLDNRRYAILNPTGELSIGSDNKYVLNDVGFVLETTSFVNDAQHTTERRLTSFSEN